MDRRKQDALEHLVNVEPRDLPAEAKIEYCRATRDLRSCGRIVQHLLASCGHTCLCAECRKQSDACPICRAPIVEPEASPRLRLYDELVEAKLVPHALDEDARERDGQVLAIHVHRLCAIFDVALENNLVCLVCHYVSDVCMDEAAVSSDALMSILLDGDVVKDWCKRTAGDILRSLRDIYNLGFKQLQSKADAMYKSLRKLEGLQYVLEALEAPILDPLSASLREVRNLLEGVRRVSQHVEVMAWCTRQSFLENLPSCFATISQWRVAVKERKIAAQERAWADDRTSSGHTVPRQGATLFIEDALENLGISREEEDSGKDILELHRLKKDFVPSSPLHRSRRDGGAVYPVISSSSTVYPPQNVRAAVDLLFLEGSSELILAKKAIFLYYLFDRHWTLSDPSWRNVVDDYVYTFGIARAFMLESLLFYLLDDNSDQALEEGCGLLPEIVSPNVHPKIPLVLLERGMPEVALSVLRCSGRDGHFGTVSGGSLALAVLLPEAVTAVRVRLQCGLLAEAYLYQRAHWLRVKSEEGRKGPSLTPKIDMENLEESRNWFLELEVLVEEICWFSISHNRLKDMTELPWLSDEEKVLKQSLFDHVVQDPSSTTGNFLVAFYIQRCRYVEAYFIHKRLCDLEQQYMRSCRDEAKKARMLAACAHRTRITEACVDLLPQIQQQDVRSGKISDVVLERRAVAQPSPQGMDLERPDTTIAKPARLANDVTSSPLFQSPAPKKLSFSSLSQQEGVASTSSWSKHFPPPVANGKGMRRPLTSLTP